MRFAKFWKMQVFELSLTERMFYRDAIRTLQAWAPMKEQFADLDLIRKMLDAEIHLPAMNPVEDDATAISSCHEAASYRLAGASGLSDIEMSRDHFLAK